MSITFYCDRDESESDLNMSNSNAYAVMQAAGIEPDYCGTIALGLIPSVLCGIALRLNGSVREFTREPTDIRQVRVVAGEGNVLHLVRGPRMVDCGISVGYVRERLTQLQALLLLAQERGVDVHWG
jgi:hypothetical protein